MGRRAKPPKKNAEAKRPLAGKSPKPAPADVRDLEKRLAESLEREKAKDRALAEALEQQTATAEILSVISASPTDLRPVFDAILQSALRLCRAVNGGIWRLETGVLSPVAFAGSRSPEWDALTRGIEPIPPRREMVSGWAVLEGQVLSVPDIEADDRFPNAQRLARTMGIRSVLGVPMLREGVAVGAMVLNKMEPAGFGYRQIDLVRTFADQAVIAIENVRLFTETKKALEQQTATGEILRVISSSPTDVQPVFDTIVQNAMRLCDAVFGRVFRRRGDTVLLAANANFPDELGHHPAPLNQDTLSGGVISSGQLHLSVDVESDPAIPPLARETFRHRGVRSILTVPMLREGQAIGAISVGHRNAGAFTDAHVALLQTFADQAVIAIENVRLFKELQTSNRELTTALDTQTATSDILRVISRSQTDVQPVFQAIVDSAARLLCGNSGVLSRIVGHQIELAAFTRTDEAGDALLASFFPISIQSSGSETRPIRDRVIGERIPYNVADVETDPRVGQRGRANARARGYRSQLVVPMLRHDEPIGTIAVTRSEPGAFSDEEISLLQIFADQAVIAIENARLLSELQARTQELSRSVGELQVLGEVSQAVSSTLDLQTVLSTIVGRATLLAGADAGIIYEYDGEREIFRPRATERLEPEIVDVLVTAPVRKGEGATGQLAVLREPVQLADIQIDYLPNLHHARDAFIRAGYRALLAVPLLREGHLIGGLTVMRKMPGEFPRETIELLQTLATQSFLAIQNARLFREIGDKSRQLEVASQHKSEFLANMSHELRTPLNAIIGFSEVLTERMFGELNEKQDEYLKDIYASGQHLLSLINDILDLSKIEAGHMELELTDFHLPTALENALTLVRERAGRRGLALGQTVDERLGQIRGDERKVKQVLLNLLSNALKFTPEGGRVEVSASVVDAMAEISVTDTGVGIASEDQDAIFEEFRQVGTAAKKVEGTGLGLALSRKFVELHGGKIWVTSQVGEGSTFTFTLPVRFERETGA